MRKYKSAYLKPYIRRAKKQDFNIENVRGFYNCMRIVTWRGSKAYVLVLRGSNAVFAIGHSKSEIKNYLTQKCNHVNREFNKWCNENKHDCQKKSFQERKN